MQHPCTAVFAFLIIVSFILRVNYSLHKSSKKYSGYKNFNSDANENYAAEYGSFT